MSWSDSLLSPSEDFHEHNSYPQNLTHTNIVLPSLQPNAPTYPFTFERPRTPRLSSPRLFRDTLFPSSTTGTSNLPHLPRPVPGDFDNTLRDVQSALHNADMALRNAQAAFRQGRTTRSNASNVVDLTGSDEIEDDGGFGPSGRTLRRQRVSVQGDSTLETDSVRAPTRRQLRAQHEASQRDRTQQREQRITLDAQSPSETDTDTDTDAPSTLVLEGDEGHDEDEVQVIQATTARMLSMTELLQPGTAVSQADRSAVRRQRQARRNWERVERRNRERAQQQAQSNTRLSPQDDQALESGVANTGSQNDSQRSARRRNSNNSISQISVPSIDLTENIKDDDPSEPVDLTGADDDKTLRNILAKEQQDAIAAQPKPTSASNTANSLSNYKCAICMDSPTNATTTICGHLFCHRCILDSLKWSERQRREDALHPRQVNGLCPVCRKSLKNKEVGAAGRGPGSGGLVALEIKKVSRKQYNDDKQRLKFLADIEGKGKQRAETEDVDDIENIDTIGDEPESSGKGQRKRRRGQS